MHAESAADKSFNSSRSLRLRPERLAVGSAPRLGVTVIPGGADSEEVGALETASGIVAGALLPFSSPGPAFTDRYPLEWAEALSAVTVDSRELDTPVPAVSEASRSPSPAPPLAASDDDPMGMGDDFVAPPREQSSPPPEPVPQSRRATVEEVMDEDDPQNFGRFVESFPGEDAEEDESEVHFFPWDSLYWRSYKYSLASPRRWYHGTFHFENVPPVGCPAVGTDTSCLGNFFVPLPLPTTTPTCAQRRITMAPSKHTPAEQELLEGLTGRQVKEFRNFMYTGEFIALNAARFLDHEWIDIPTSVRP
ncbi:hypothetical protein B0H10DRAFT_2443344 [Mycena sp. CBHHK59/15]|nr:hypothetical protein B0H10DRAFT_2443344 [Mycena sp. CBHHK59/15]